MSCDPEVQAIRDKCTCGYHGQGREIDVNNPDMERIIACPAHVGFETREDWFKRMEQIRNEETP